MKILKMYLKTKYFGVKRNNLHIVNGTLYNPHKFQKTSKYAKIAIIVLVTL
jgi:hypothetical protein